MGYYQGDFYAGSRGDPGFFSFLGRAIKGVAGLASGMMPGGGLVSRAAGALVHVPGGGAISRAIKSPLARRVGGMVIKHPVLSAAGAAGVIGAGVEGGRMLRGRHPAMAGMRRHRRMNVTNVRALRRSIRRAQGFAKLAKRVLHFTSPRPPRGRVVFKRRAKKRII